MPTYQRFEEVPVWQSGAELYDRIAELLQRDSWHLSWSFRNQLERATLSISNNIAEGLERGTTKELLAFLYIARGSAGEVRSMLHLISRQSNLSNLKPEISNLMSLAESCSRQLRAWADALQHSEITGPRHLNENSRTTYLTAVRKRSAP